LVDFDLGVIGGGAGGLSAARAAVHRRARVLLVAEGELGGDCTFTGCVPSKTLIESAAGGLLYGQAIGRVRDVVARVAAGETAEVLRAEGVTIVKGRAWLRAAGGVEVDGRVVHAPRIVLATGARPAMPAIPGLVQLDVLTNENLFGLTELPDSVAVLGGGAIGCELAQALSRFGAAVTLVEAADRLLAREEPEASQVLAAALSRDGVRVRTGSAILRAEPTTTGAALTLHDGCRLEVARVLAAVGRSPDTAGLGLEARGVRTNRGYVVTDARLRTSVPGIYAVGDVTGRLQLTHAADEMGRIAVANAFARLPRARFVPGRVPWVTFTSPEIARVGMTEEQATVRGGRVAFLPMSEVDRALAADAVDGFVKLIAGPRPVLRNSGGGRLLGATVVAERAGELIHEPALAMRTAMFTGRLAQTTHAYPTWSVAVQQAAAQFFTNYRGRAARPAARR